MTALATLAMVALMPSAAYAADTTAPTTPGIIAVSSVTATGASLKWGGSSDAVGIEGYRVYRSLGSGVTPTSLIATTDAVTSYSATHLYSGKTYTFGVVAIDAANNKSLMRTVTVTIGSSTDTTVPAAPSSGSLSFRVFSASRIDVVWGASASSDVAGYQIFRDGGLVGTVDLPNTPRYSDNGLTAATSYSYSIKAVDSAGNVSAGSTAKSAKTLSADTVIIARGPYLSSVTASSAVISWWTNLATSGAVGINGTTVADPAGSVQHHAVSVTGLTVGSTYPYSVTSGTATASGTLYTAASVGTPFSFAAIGDFGGGSTGEGQNATNIASAGTQFIQTVGDNVYPSSGLPDPNFTTTYSDLDQRLFKPFATAIRSQAFFPANGNKEYYGDGEFWNAFPMPGSNNSWYSYDWGNAHILVLDSEQPFASGTEQYNFAQADLAAHQSATWRIVAIQRPPYSSTTANSSSKPVQLSLVPLFQTQKVDLVLSGNSHNYERTYPLTNGVAATGGVTYVVTGAGGNGFNAFAMAQPAYSAFRESSYYQYAKVTVSPTALTVDAIRADTNAVFDTTTITASGSGDTTPPTVPSSVTATAVSSSEIDVSWTASTDAVGVAGYKVFKDGATTPVADVTSGTSFPNTGLTAGSTHSYTVIAYDAAGNSSINSASVSATTPTGGISAPTGLTATASGSGQINLSWTGVSGASGYYVYRGGTKITTAAVNATTYSDNGLTPSTSYTYAVTAVAANVESAKSSPVTATTTAGGGVLTVSPSDDATISKASGSTGTNYGKATTLTVDADGSMNDFLVRFPVPASCTPTAATLTLTVGSGSTNSSAHGGDVYAAPGDWAETSINATTAPPTTGSPVITGAVAVSTAYSVNVSSLLTAGLSGGFFSIRATTTSNDAAAYVSKDASNGTTAGPKLQLTC